MSESDIKLTPMPEVLDALRAGKPVLVADDEGRENEGDAIMAAELATPEWVGWIIRNSSGLLCAPVSRDIADGLNLPIMVERNEDTRRTAYTVTVDASHGITTGISATDRSRTLNVLANPESTSHDLIRPGHILPLRAMDGGIHERAGHTEAAIDLMRLAGLRPAAVIAEIVDDAGEMMRMPELMALGRKTDIPVTTVAALMAWIDEHGIERPKLEDLNQKRVHFEVETTVPTEFGLLTFRGYRDRMTGSDHVAIVSGKPTKNGTLVRVHSECLTGEALGSLKCECGPQLDEALRTIAREGGVVLYMRGHEGRGIGLVNKFKAYRLQEEGLDTLDANLALGFPADARDYTAAARMLEDLGIESVRLLSNNPEKRRQLIEHGIQIDGLVPLVVGLGDFNVGYLDVKRDRMGHQLPTVLPILENLAPTKVVND
ncbi:MAG: GTP cyclohydrolase II [Actinobacteria bacterium]|jgi:3,4-dihydroxy 2-butanone 4-phosphate synthase / GTP cyclohydrolase II|nr:GTP cyclohydrolase II [Actinomycetota bacterium]